MMMINQQMKAKAKFRCKWLTPGMTGSEVLKWRITTRTSNNRCRLHTTSKKVQACSSNKWWCSNSSRRWWAASSNSVQAMIYTKSPFNKWLLLPTITSWVRVTDSNWQKSKCCWCNSYRRSKSLSNNNSSRCLLNSNNNTWHSKRWWWRWESAEQGLYRTNNSNLKCRCSKRNT